MIESNSETVVPKAPLPKGRVASLDALRGFDLFLLFGLGSIFCSFVDGPFKEYCHDSKFWETLKYQICSHSDWTGFTLHDLIMPLFMFMAGVTIPYSMAKFKKSESNPNPSYGKFWLRLTRRIILLWIFGMIAQGNLLQLKWEGLRLYSNTLQAIAAGYLVAVACFFFAGKIGQTVIAFVLMFIFWASMTWIKVGDCGGGSFEEWNNLAEWIDRAVLGRWMDGVSFNEDGTFQFAHWYHYTWILSSLTFAATTISGLLAGEIIKTRTESTKKLPDSGHTTSLILFGIGAISALVGWFWGKVPEGYFCYCPLIKHLWTPSMVLYASGLSFMLLGLFHEVYDVLHLPYLKTFFVVIGTNSILLYMLPHFIDFRAITKNLIFGLEHHIGTWYAPVLSICSFGATWLFLWVLYKNKKFLRL